MSLPAEHESEELDVDVVGCLSPVGVKLMRLPGCKHAFATFVRNIVNGDWRKILRDLREVITLHADTTIATATAQAKRKIEEALPYLAENHRNVAEINLEHANEQQQRATEVQTQLTSDEPLNARNEDNPFLNTDQTVLLAKTEFQDSLAEIQEDGDDLVAFDYAGGEAWLDANEAEWLNSTKELWNE